ncbi:MMPL family transporter [soil metagenome]
MKGLSRFVLRRKLLVVLLTLLALAIGVGATALLVLNVSERNAYPGLPAYEANQEIMRTYGNGGYERPFVPIVTLPEGQTVDSPGVESALDRAFAAVAEANDARVVSYADTGDKGVVGEDGRTTFGLVFGRPVEQGGLPGGALGEVPDLSPSITEAMESELPPGATLHVTGLDTLATSGDAGGLNVPVKLLVGSVAALVVLLWVFRSALALVPLLVALVAIPLSFAALLIISPFVEIHETTVMMIPLFGLGVAIDYALLLVSRWREEQARGHRGDEAVHRAATTAGHAILFSGGAVAIGLLTMVVLPIPFLRSLGLGGTMIAAFSVLVSLTLLPIVLATTGRRLDRKRLEADGRRLAKTGEPGRGSGAAEKAAEPGRVWSALARGVVRFRWPTALGAGGVLLGLAIIGLGINLSIPESKNLATSGPGHEGLAALEAAGIPSGALTSFDVFVPSGTDPDAVASDLAALPGVATVAAPEDDRWRRGGTAVISVIPTDESGSAAGEETIRRVIDAVPEGTMVGGNAAQQMDYVDATYGAFPLMLGLISFVTFVMLARAVRSLLLPLKAIVLNLLSLGAVLGAMVILWQFGWGTEAIFGIPPNGALGTFVPVTIFAFLYGLSMDYEVFILARMREEYDRTGSTHKAVVEGIGRTGRLVTSVALILFLSFAAAATGGEIDVSIFASGIALGILLDATLIRAVLVPAVVAMMGRWNWWLPGWAARVLHVPPSPLQAEPPEPATAPVGGAVGEG